MWMVIQVVDIFAEVTIGDARWVERKAQVPLMGEGIVYSISFVVVSPDILDLILCDVGAQQEAVVVRLGLPFKHTGLI